jgi:hypothetical protein
MLMGAIEAYPISCEDKSNPISDHPLPLGCWRGAWVVSRFGGCKRREVTSPDHQVESQQGHS